MIRVRGAAVFMTVLTVATMAACTKDKRPSEWGDGTPQQSAAAPAPSVAPKPVPIPEKTTTGKPEITKNPDGTVNDVRKRPVTSDTGLSAGGLGPYQVGAQLTKLKSDGLVKNAKSLDCKDYVGAAGTAKFHAPKLVFYRGKLLRMTIADGKVATARGIKLGSTMTAVQAKYPDGKQIDDWTGRGAWVATIGDYGLLFDMKDQKVSGIQAGMAEPMQFKYTDNQGC